MMPLTYTYLCVAAAMVAALFSDCRAHGRLQDTGETQDPNERPTDTVLMLSPFLVFFYPEGFWLNFAGFMALWALGCMAVLALNALGRLDINLEMQKYMAIGVPLLVGLGYLIFYHDGPFLDASEVSVSQLDEQGSTPATNTVLAVPHWVWWAYGLLITSSLLVSRSKDGALVAAIGLLLGLVILPFYSGYYWWSLGAGALIFFLSLSALLQSVDATAKGGIGFVLVWMAQMAFMGSIVVYAIFF